MDDLPGIAVTKTLDIKSAANREFTLLIGYDDIKSVRYYNEGDFSAYWTRKWPTFDDALKAAAKETLDMRMKSEYFDREFTEVMSNTVANFGS